MKLCAPKPARTHSQKVLAALLFDARNKTKSMGRNILILVSICFLTCCSYFNADNKSEKQKTNSLLDSLTKISLPISATCGESSKVFDFSYNRKIISDLPENLRFGGLLKKTDKYFAVLLIDTYADYQNHFLATVSMDGKIIEMLELFSAGCSEDENYWGEAKYTIDNNLKIIQTDTSATYKRNDVGTIIKKTIKTSSHRLLFYVDKNGNINNTKDNNTDRYQHLKPMRVNVVSRAEFSAAKSVGRVK